MMLKYLAMRRKLLAVRTPHHLGQLIDTFCQQRHSLGQFHGALRCVKP